MGALTVGQELGGRYRIEAVLARGGMGAVYRAKDVRLGRDVAIKVLLSELAADVTEIARFEREASAVARLHHPGIVQVLDLGRDGDTPFLVMEHVQGRTLSNILGSEGRLDPVRACDLVEQALFAIPIAHGAGIVHRDLKPANLMVVPTGGREMIKVLDFGIAQLKTGTAYTRLTQTGALVGTPMFMAPEQVRGEVCDARTDVYAMGVVLWCALTGQRPFSTKDLGEIIGKVLEEMPARADRLEPSVPAPMASAAEVAMAKRPDARFASASAFASALADLRVRASTSARTPTPVATHAIGPAPSMHSLPSRSSAVPFETPAPAPRGGTVGPISTRAIALTALGLLVVLCAAVCLVGGYVLHAMSSGGGPIAGAPSLPTSWPGTAPSGNTGGSGADGSTCEQAARCCEVLVGNGSSCGSLRGLDRYPTGAGACANALAQYRESAQRLGRSCD